MRVTESTRRSRLPDFRIPRPDGVADAAGAAGDSDGGVLCAGAAVEDLRRSITAVSA